MNIFLGGVIQQLFSAMRKLTIMVHLLITNVKIPANAQFFFAGLLSFVTFDLIELGPYIRKALNLYDDELSIRNLSDLGYSSNYFAINIGSLLLVMVYLICLLIFYACTWMIRNKKFIHYRRKIVSGLFWNKIFSFINESYLQLTVSCIVNFVHFDLRSYGTFISTNAAMFAFAVCLLFPIFSLCFLKNNRSKLRTWRFKDKYESLYEGLAYKRGHYIVLAEPFFSFLRVLILISALIILQKNSYFQIFVVNFSSTFMVIYAGIASPYQDKT
jgi:hypothetical protein